ASLRPKVDRLFPTEGAVEGEPTWIGAALQTGVWRTITGSEPSVIAHIDALALGGQQSVRVAVVVDPSSAGAGSTSTSFYEITAEGVLPASPLKAKPVWRLPGVLP